MFSLTNSLQLLCATLPMGSFTHGLVVPTRQSLQQSSSAHHCSILPHGLHGCGRLLHLNPDEAGADLSRLPMFVGKGDADHDPAEESILSLKL